VPLYEHRDAEGNIVERVRPVEGSREDQRLAASPSWTLVEETPVAEPTATAPAAAPAGTVPTGPAPTPTEAPRSGTRSRKPS